MKKRSIGPVMAVIMTLIMSAVMSGCGSSKEQETGSDKPSTPVFGAKPELYEKKIDDALAGRTDTESTYSNSYENADGMYRVRIVDDDMKPVEGVIVQYCSDDTCKMAVTDKDGIMTFNDPPAEYEVHVLKVPEGYDENTNTYKTETFYSDMVIIIQRQATP